MITVTEITKKSENLYTEYLRSIVSGETFFPKTIRSDKSVSNDFGEMRKELAEVIGHSKDNKNFGYTINYKLINTRKHGVQSLPEEISFQTETDYLKFLHKDKEAESFKNNAAFILTHYPVLNEWIKKFPLKVIENKENWIQLLDICTYFKQNSKPDLYIRELPVRVHTKFIEHNKGILLELLNAILPSDSINHEYPTTKDFEKRFGLRFNQSRIRLRILDQDISEKYLSGITDIEVTEEEFNKLKIPCKKVFILENKTNYSNLMNFLTLPHLENSIGIFGSGYKISDLKNAVWLANKEIYYWGDIDTHGMQILSQMRKYFPNTRSLMMDFETLNTFKEEWGRGEPINVTDLPNLSSEERELFEFIKADNINTIRLEQEKINQTYVIKNIKRYL